MTISNSLVIPSKFKNGEIGSLAIMVATEIDFNLMERSSNSKFLFKKKLYTSKLSVYENSSGLLYSVVGPFIGAPYAAMLFETLISWGINRLIFFGWCGSIDCRVGIGEVIFPISAIVDEGTSRHYDVANESLILPSTELLEVVKNLFSTDDLTCHSGSVWTTDGIFRETLEKVNYFRDRQALAVEMEASVIFTVANFWEVDAASILVVSDAIRGNQWYRGSNNKVFNKTRTIICDCINKFCFG